MSEQESLQPADTTLRFSDVFDEIKPLLGVPFGSLKSTWGLCPKRPTGVSNHKSNVIELVTLDFVYYALRSTKKKIASKLGT